MMKKEVGVMRKKSEPVDQRKTPATGEVNRKRRRIPAS